MAKIVEGDVHIFDVRPTCLGPASSNNSLLKLYFLSPKCLTIRRCGSPVFCVTICCHNFLAMHSFVESLCLIIQIDSPTPNLHFNNNVLIIFRVQVNSVWNVTELLKTFYYCLFFWKIRFYVTIFQNIVFK